MRIHYGHEGEALCGKKGNTILTTTTEEVNCPTCLRDIEEINESVGAGEGFN